MRSPIIEPPALSVGGDPIEVYVPCDEVRIADTVNHPLLPLSGTGSKES